MALSNVPQCWRARALTQTHVGVQKPAVDHPALEHSPNQVPDIKAGPPAQRHWMSPAQDPVTNPEHFPPVAKHQWQVTQATDEHQTCKSKLKMESFLICIICTQQGSSLHLTHGLTGLLAAFKPVRVGSESVCFVCFLLETFNNSV